MNTCSIRFHGEIRTILTRKVPNKIVADFSLFFFYCIFFRKNQDVTFHVIFLPSQVLFSLKCIKEKKNVSKCRLLPL